MQRHGIISSDFDGMVMPKSWMLDYILPFFRYLRDTESDNIGRVEDAHALHSDDFSD